MKYLNKINIPILKLYMNITLKKYETSIHDNEILLETDGCWVEYNKLSQAQDVSRVLSLYPALEWCTKAVLSSQDQLRNGALHIFFSRVPDDHPNKDWVKHGYPRLCIRTIKSDSSIKIAETRGCLSGQEIDEHISKTNILSTKLKEFGTEGEATLK